MKNRELISIGRVVNTHGIRGKLRIVYYNEEKTSFFRYKKILLRDSFGQLEPFEVTDARIHRKSIIVQFKGFDNLDHAERLVGASVLVERSALPELDEGEYYWVDLIGMEVTTAKGDRVGELSDIIPTRGADVFVIEADEREVLVPATEEVIREIDLASRRMVICPVKGLMGDDSV